MFNAAEGNSVKQYTVANALTKAFNVFFAVSCIILTVSIAFSNNAAVSICGTLLLAGVCALGAFCVKRVTVTDKQFKIIVICSLLFYFLICFYTANLMKVALPSDTDIVYDSVADLLDDGVLNQVNPKMYNYYPNLGLVTNADYFCRYYNNIFLLLLLSGLYFVGGIFGIKAGTPQGQTLAIGFTALCVTISILFICLIVKKLFKSNTLALISAAISMACTAFFYSIPNFYTDILIIPFALAAVYVFLLLCETPSLFFAVLTGVLFAMASSMKITALVFFIGAVIYLCITTLRKEQFKKSLCLIGIMIVSLVLCLMLFKLFYTNTKMLDFSKEEQLSIPVQTWLVFGSHDNGSYSYNDMEKIVASALPADREKAANNLIKSNYLQYSIPHLIEFEINKLIYTWNDGQFDGNKYSKWPVESNWTAFLIREDQWGYITLYWYGQCYVFMLYIAALAVSFVQLCAKKSILPWYFNLCVFGTMLYLTFFETSPRRAMVAVPFLILNVIYLIYLLSKRPVPIANKG